MLWRGQAMLFWSRDVYTIRLSPPLCRGSYSILLHAEMLAMHVSRALRFCVVGRSDDDDDDDDDDAGAVGYKYERCRSDAPCIFTANGLAFLLVPVLQH